MTDDVQIEIIEWGDDIAHVYRKEGKVYIYPEQDFPEIKEITKRLESSGADVVWGAVEGDVTVYSQEEDYYGDDYTYGDEYDY